MSSSTSFSSDLRPLDLTPFTSFPLSLLDGGASSATSSGPAGGPSPPGPASEISAGGAATNSSSVHSAASSNHSEHHAGVTSTSLVESGPHSRSDAAPKMTRLVSMWKFWQWTKHITMSAACFAAGLTRRGNRWWSHSHHRQRVLLQTELFGLRVFLNDPSMTSQTHKLERNIQAVLHDSASAQPTSDEAAATAGKFFLQEPSAVRAMVSRAWKAAAAVCRIRCVGFDEDSAECMIFFGTGFITADAPRSIFTNSHVMNLRISLDTAVFSFQCLDGGVVRWVDIFPSQPAGRSTRHCVRILTESDNLEHGPPDMAVITFAPDSQEAKQLEQLRRDRELPVLFAHMVQANEQQPADIDGASFRLPRRGERVCLVHYAGVDEPSPGFATNELGESAQISLFGKVTGTSLLDCEHDAEEAAARPMRRGRWGEQEVWLPATVTDVNKQIPLYADIDSYCRGGASGGLLLDNRGRPIGCLYLGTAEPPHVSGRALLFNAYTRELLHTIAHTLESATPNAAIKSHFNQLEAENKIQRLDHCLDKVLARKHGMSDFDALAADVLRRYWSNDYRGK